MDIKTELLKELNFSPKYNIEFIKTDSEFSIECDSATIKVYYSNLTEYCRSLLIIKSKGISKPYIFKEKCAFDDFGFMIDCSRNAVLKVETVKQLIRNMALMGYNQLMLYTEDTYEVDDEPYFGYLRGRYSQEELNDMCEYAEQFGIELVPCIQTLAHLNAITRWGEYSPTIDLGDILLVDNERTYTLIENMFKSLRKCYKTSKIHLGMDEAHLLGMGKFFDKHGLERRIDIFNRHLIKVISIAEKYGFKPMIWSDMFFRSMSGGQYKPFDKQTMLEIKKSVPDGVDLVCWDYYNTDVKYYEEFIDSHKILTNDVIFANGLWSWQGFSPFITYTIESIKCSTKACINKGVKRFFSTSWGDDGAECAIFSLLPMLLAQAQLAYGDSELISLEETFYALTDVPYSYFKAIEDVNKIGNYEFRRQNPSKYMLYNDVLLGVVDCLVVEGDKEKLKSFLKLMSNGNGGKYEYLFKPIKLLAEVVYFKYDLGVKLRKAYKDNDERLLKIMRDEKLPELVYKIEMFYLAFRDRWYADNKPFGFDVQDIRLGGLIQRVKNAILTLDEYLDGKINSIPELEEEIINFHCNVDYDKSITLNKWSINSTNSVI